MRQAPARRSHMIGMKGPDRNPELTQWCSVMLRNVDSMTQPMAAATEKYRNHTTQFSYIASIMITNIPLPIRVVNAPGVASDPSRTSAQSVLYLFA